MNNIRKKQENRFRRKHRVRAKISGTSSRPRLAVFRSLRHVWVQVINDEKGITLVSASDKELKDKGNKTEIATKVGELIATKSLEKKITSVVFDKSSYKYHGRVKALADAARKKGLKF